jgi:ubiquinone/menaquinone biosynthesis C-methylase UbiE
MVPPASTRPELQRRLPSLLCPACLVSSLELGPGLTCRLCHRRFDDEAGRLVSLLPAAVSATKQKIQAFWGDTYRQWYGADDAKRERETLLAELERLEDLFRRRRHLAVTEMDLGALGGREVLEIGCGAGAHSALFRRAGAHVTSVDLTAERVLATARKHELLRDLSPGSGFALQADAEHLPFADGTFDVVYSNGVLHHTEDTPRCLREVFRVLKPGGTAVIMLYSRVSAYFLLKLLPKALLSGEARRRREAHWLGRMTEGEPEHQGERNPVTQVFNARQIEHLFRPFARVRLRKSGFSIGHLPVPRLSAHRERILGWFGLAPHEGGRMIYGSPYVPESSLERGLGRLLGFDWNVRAEKGDAGPLSRREPPRARRRTRS